MIGVESGNYSNVADYQKQLSIRSDEFDQQCFNDRLRNILISIRDASRVNKNFLRLITDRFVLDFCILEEMDLIKKNDGFYHVCDYGTLFLSHPEYDYIDDFAQIFLKIVSDRKYRKCFNELIKHSKDSHYSLELEELNPLIILLIVLGMIKLIHNRKKSRLNSRYYQIQDVKVKQVFSKLASMISLRSIKIRFANVFLKLVARCKQFIIRHVCILLFGLIMLMIAYIILKSIGIQIDFIDFISANLRKRFCNSFFLENCEQTIIDHTR